MTELRLGIVGCGAVAELYHLPAVAACPDVRLVGLADPRREHAAELAERYGAELVTEGAAGLIDAVDAVVVATPNSLHAEAAIELARAGVHVLVEKPLARTTAECDAIADAVAAAGVVAAVGHDFRHFPVARAARELLDLVGDVESAELLQSAGIDSEIGAEGEDDPLTVLVPEDSLEAAEDAIEALSEPDDLISEP